MLNRSEGFPEGDICFLDAMAQNMFTSYVGLETTSKSIFSTSNLMFELFKCICCTSMSMFGSPMAYFGTSISISGGCTQFYGPQGPRNSFSGSGVPAATVASQQFCSLAEALVHSVQEPDSPFEQSSTRPKQTRPQTTARLHE